MPRNVFSLRNICIAIVAVLAVSLVTLRAGQSPSTAVQMDSDDIAGVVTGPNGPEAGVWVIAETRDLPTRYIKIVVTDDEGRYLVPDLPQATYDVWVRGYGLVDSEKVQAKSGDDAQPDGRGRTRCESGRGILPSPVLVRLASAPSARRVPGHGTGG